MNRMISEGNFCSGVVLHVKYGWKWITCITRLFLASDRWVLKWSGNQRTDHFFFFFLPLFWHYFPILLFVSDVLLSLPIFSPSLISTSCILSLFLTSSLFQSSNTSISWQKDMNKESWEGEKGENRCKLTALRRTPWERNEMVNSSIFSLLLLSSSIFSIPLSTLPLLYFLQ